MNSIKVNDLCVLKIEDNNFVIDFETIILKKIFLSLRFYSVVTFVEI